MPVSERVRADDPRIVDFRGKYIIARAGKRLRVYEDASEYSQTSGGVSKLGHVMRDQDDRPINFETAEQARSWVDGGCVIYPEVKYQKED